MFKTKGFKLKVVPKTGLNLVKEEVTKTFTEDSKAIQAMYALDSDLNMLTPHILVDESVIPVDVWSSERGMSVTEGMAYCSEHRIPLYYLFNQLSYFGLHKVKLVDGKQVINLVNLYLPSKVERSKLISVDVTASIDKGLRNGITDKYTPYVVNRL